MRTHGLGANYGPRCTFELVKSFGNWRKGLDIRSNLCVKVGFLAPKS